MRKDQRYAAAVRPQIEHVLELIDGVTFKADSSSMAGRSVESHRFNRCILLHEAMQSIAGDDALFDGPEIYDLWPVHVRALVLGGEHGGIAAASSISSVSVKQVRGLVCRPMSRMIREDMARIYAGTGNSAAVGLTSSRIYGVTAQGELLILSGVRQPTPVFADHQAALRVQLGIALNMEYQWTVELWNPSAPNCMKIRIPTSSIGARQLLSLRDVPAGRERRTALRHWVREHQRIIRRHEVNERETQVRHHLRGVTPFEWEDLHGVVRPSPYDLRRNLETGS